MQINANKTLEELIKYIFQTNIGKLLIAINPLKPLPLYGDELINSYKIKNVSMLPHIYSIGN